MKKSLLSILAFSGISISIAQNVNIPDANFKAYLVGNTSINTNSDTEIQVSEAQSFTGSIICPSMSITDMTGLEEFTSLTYLECWNNPLTSLDVSTNTELTNLDCGLTQLTSLDVSNNSALTLLGCAQNQLTSLDVSNLVNLVELYVYANQLTSLDVSNSPNLTVLACTSNQLESLNAANGNNTNFTYFAAYGNSGLECIQVDDVTYSDANWGGSIDSQSYFSTNCNCVVSIPDANFKAYLVGNTSINTNSDTEIQCSEASAYAGIINCANLSISDLTGIEAFINITDLLCGNNQITSLDVSTLTAMTNLNCFENQLTSLDVSSCSSLNSLICRDNQLSTLNIANGNNTNFIGLFAFNNSNLTCIEVDDANYSNTNWISNGAFQVGLASYSEDCLSTSSVLENKTETFVKIFPNPAKDQITIETLSNVNIKIITVLGETVFITRLTSGKNLIEISTFTPGVYMIQTDSGMTQKFIKN